MWGEHTKKRKEETGKEEREKRQKRRKRYVPSAEPTR
jgi:hypothetical protein